MSITLVPVTTGEFSVAAEEFDSVYYVDTFTKTINILPSGKVVTGAVLVANDPVKSAGVSPSATPASAIISGSYNDLFPDEEITWTNSDLSQNMVTTMTAVPSSIYKAFKIKPDYTRSESTTYTLTVNWITTGTPPVPGVTVFTIDHIIYNHWDKDKDRVDDLIGRQV